MSEQEKDKRTRKSPRNSKNKDGPQSPRQRSTEVTSPKEAEPVPEKAEQIVSQTPEHKSSNIASPEKTNTKDGVGPLKSPAEGGIIQKESDKTDSDIKKNQDQDNDDDQTPVEEVPTLSGWLASGFSSIVKTAKDSVNKVSFFHSVFLFLQLISVHLYSLALWNRSNEILSN